MSFSRSLDLVPLSCTNDFHMSGLISIMLYGCAHGTRFLLLAKLHPDLHENVAMVAVTYMDVADSLMFLVANSKENPSTLARFLHRLNIFASRMVQVILNSQIGKPYLEDSTVMNRIDCTCLYVRVVILVDIIKGSFWSDLGASRGHLETMLGS